MIKVFLIFLAFIKFSSSQSATCNYILEENGRYRCEMTINNPNGLEISSIGGTHLPGQTNTNVYRIIVAPGSISTIVPQIFCTQFINIELIVAQNVGIQRLTQTSFSNCRRMWHLNIEENPISEIHASTFVNNRDLVHFLLSRTQLRSLPEALFRETTRLQIFSFMFNPQLTDLPPFIFVNNPLLNYVRLTTNALNIWREQWFASTPALATLLIYQNQISQIPRNAIRNSGNLQVLYMQFNPYTIVESSSFGYLGSLERFHVGQSVQAIDHALIDRMPRLTRFIATNNPCVNHDFENFQSNRDVNMAILEPCFSTFDLRNISFDTTGIEPIFNSISVQKIHLSVQVRTDAIVVLSDTPDMSSQTIEIRLGVEENVRHQIFENGVQNGPTLTRGYVLSEFEMRSFAIGWEDGFLFVTILGDDAPLITAILRNPFNVKYVGVMTRGENASWRIAQIR